MSLFATYPVAGLRLGLGLYLKLTVSPALVGMAFCLHLCISFALVLHRLFTACSPQSQDLCSVLKTGYAQLYAVISCSYTQPYPQSGKLAGN